jgi:RNA polymerase sigma factor (sigma-70 family)
MIMDIITVRGLELSGVDFVPVRSNFEDLYRHEYPGLVAVATALTGDRRDGEDLVQDTMVKAFVRWRHVSVLARPGGWCHFVLLNACRSWWRRRRTESRYIEGRRADETSDAAPSADVVAFWELVRALPSRPRTAVALHFAGGHTMAEVARILEVPEGTVRSDIARARVVLIRELGLSA